MPTGAQVIVMGRPELTRLYAAAIGEAGREAIELDGEQASSPEFSKLQRGLTVSAREVCTIISTSARSSPSSAASRPDDAEATADAIFEGGIRIIEVPLNSPDPLTSIERIAAKFGDRALVGAGTVLGWSRCRGADAGGRIIVSPDTNIEVISAAAAAGLVSSPGYFTPSEAFAALRAGAHALKLFPAEGAAPGVMKAQLAVIPKDVPVLAVGGIKPDNMQPWLDAGASGFGLGVGSLQAWPVAAETLAKARAYVAGADAPVKPIRIAIIGFGKIAADQHLPSIKANPRFELAATSSRSGQGAEPGLHRLARADPDGRRISTPSRSRRRRVRVTKLRGSASRPAFIACSKSRRRATLAEIDDLAGLAEAQQVTLYTTWHARHHAAVEAAAKALAGKRIAAFEILWHEDVHKWHPGPAMDLGAGRIRRVRSRHQCLLDRDAHLPRPLFVREAEPQRALERPDADRRRRAVRQPASRWPASRKPRLAPGGGRGMDDHRADDRRDRSPAEAAVRSYRSMASPWPWPTSANIRTSIASSST